MALKVCPQCGNEFELDVRFCPNDGSTLRAQGSGNDLVGTIVAERYEVLKKLGEGGMGQVYLAQHIRIKRKSALKIMHPSMVHDPDAISRFYREAENASKISHTNVAAIYDFGETSDGLIYLAMEFVEGQALTSLIERTGALPARRAAEITRQAADALNVAHDMGIVHRDLKPDNIMISQNRDGSDCVKVVDFGIAKVADNESQKVTKTGLVVGTPEYMSPEQLAGDKLDGRSDVYSLALVAFNMFTGKLPFPSETVQESMIMRLTDRPRTLREMKPDVSWPPELEAVMARALQRDARERYQKAGEFGKAIAKAVEGMPDQMTAAEAGTMVLSAPVVPPTVVGGAAPAAPALGGATAVVGGAGAAPGSGATRAMGATPAPAAAPERKRSALPLVGGGVAAVALLAIGAFAMSRKGDASVTPDTASAVSPSQTATSTPAPDTSKAVAAPPVGTPPVTPGTGNPSIGTPTPSTTAPAFDPAPTLRRLGRTVDADSPKPAELRRVVSEVGTLLPRLTRQDDVLRARFIRTKANGYLGNDDDASRRAACSEIAVLRDAAAGSSVADDVARLFEGFESSEYCK